MIKYKYVRIDEIMVVSVSNRGKNIILKTSHFTELKEFKLHEISDLLISLNSKYNKERFEYLSHSFRGYSMLIKSNIKGSATIEFEIIHCNKITKNNS